MRPNKKRSPTQIVGDIEQTRKALEAAKNSYSYEAKAIIFSGYGHNNEAFDSWTNIKVYKRQLSALEAELKNAYL